MESIDHLPSQLQLLLSDISPPSLLSFLDEKFQRRDDLLKASDLVSELQKQCFDLDQSLTDLNHQLETSILKFASHSEQVGSLFDVINVKLNDLRSSTCISEIDQDGKGGGGGGEDVGRAKQILGEELPALAKEVARVETVRIYAGDEQRDCKRDEQGSREKEIDPEGPRGDEWMLEICGVLFCCKYRHWISGIPKRTLPKDIGLLTNSAFIRQHYYFMDKKSRRETALKLDTLVGDIEDAVSSTMTGNRRKLPAGANLEEIRLLAIKSLKLTEDILTSVTKSRPQWTRLVSAVDLRVDRALAILRPQAIADHRALLASLGWPPTLSNLSNSKNLNAGKSSVVLNPLFTMQGDLKNQYCENFLALCSLQELQKQRKSRYLEGRYRELDMRQPLWAIEELVNPISLASQRHFKKWGEKPEFIFALVYKITRDFVDSMDELLQPLVDEARLVGYSCREEWISAMVTSLLMYLAKEIFPTYVGQLEEDNVGTVPSQARISWLHLIDLMIAFDKRVQALIADSGVLMSIREDENFQRVSTMSIFGDRPDWLELWSEIELGDVLNKMRPEMEDERNWKMKVQGPLLVAVSEGYKSPAVASAVLRHLSAIVERCRTLPSVSLRAKFIRLAGAPIVREFLDCLFRRCQEAEGLTALTDDDALIKVANTVNAARYFDSVLKDWCEDLFFLEMTLDQDHEPGITDDENTVGSGMIEGAEGGIFNEEVEKFEEFRKEWIEKISTVILRGFDAQCRDYIKNRKQWQEKGEAGWTVSKTFVGALDYLQGKVSKLEGSLNEMDFVVFWRSLASAVDRLVFNGILMSSAKFYNGGVERFGGDLEVLFGVFGAWCLRPEGFFPKVTEGLKLLRMEEHQLKEATNREMERWLKENRIRHLGVSEVERIAKNRVFMS